MTKNLKTTAVVLCVISEDFDSTENESDVDEPNQSFNNKLFNYYYYYNYYYKHYYEYFFNSNEEYFFSLILASFSFLIFVWKLSYITPRQYPTHAKR